MAITGLHGRDAEMRIVGEAVMALTEGYGSTVVVEAPAGLGKSRLVLETTASAREAGFGVTTCTFDRRQGLASLAPLDDSLQDYMPMTLRGCEDSRFGPSERLARLERLRTALDERLREQPTLIALDDLQWADPDTLLLVRLLVLQRATSPAMWLLTRRTVPSTPELGELVAALEAHGATILRLAPLPSTAVDALALELLGAPPDEVVRSLLRQCGGNPLVITELLQTLTERDNVIVDSSHARLVPSGATTLYQRLSREMGSLSQSAQQLLDVASIFGRPFDVPCISQVLGCHVAELLPSIHEAIDAGFLVEEGRLLTFCHGLMRNLTYGAIPPATRRIFHMKVANVLVSANGSSPEAAAHVVQAADAGDADAVRILLRVSDDIAPTAPGTAADVRHYANRLMPAGNGESVACTSGLLIRAGRTGEAVAQVEAALAQRPPSHVTALLLLRLAEASLTRGRTTQARHHLLIAQQLPGVPEATRCLLFTAVAIADTKAGDVDAASHAAETAIALGHASGCEYSLGHALLTMGVADRLRGYLTRSLERITAAIRLAESDALLHHQLEPYWERGRTLLALDRFEEASAAFESARQWSARLGTAGTAPLRHTCKAILALVQGRIRVAGTEAAAGLADSEQLQDSTHVPELAAVLAQVDTYRGNQSWAWEHLRRREPGFAEMSAASTQELAWASVVVTKRDEEDESLIARLAPLYDHLVNHMVPLVFDTVIGPQLVAIALNAGDQERAQVAARATDALATANPGVRSLAAAAAQARGLLDYDVRQLVAAAQAFQASPRPLARARAYEDVARAGILANRQGVAEFYLQQAMDEYERIGATALAQRIQTQLITSQNAGKRLSKTRPAFGWESLTHAELRIAQLAARGLTNRTIADRLSLSPHTVDSHLRHTFTKLDIRSRVELTHLVLANEPGLDE